MGVFDNTARRAAKRDAVGFFRWTIPTLDTALPFVGWLDARTVPPPPETELTCDSLAEFLDKDRPESPWMVVTEFQTVPTSDDLERLLEYIFRFRRERRPSYDPRLKYLVAGVLVNLTGPEQPDTLSMALPGVAKCCMNGSVVRFAMREQNAVATLARVAAGELSQCVLPWISLMRGCESTALIDEWKRLADLEPNPQIRLQYAVDALIFAELTGVWSLWKQALEGWNVRVSQQVLEWQNEAILETRRADILRLLAKRCKAPVPADLATVIEATQDMNLLLLWLDATTEASNFDEFRAAIQTNP
jgi:hypothetical protein